MADENKIGYKVLATLPLEEGETIISWAVKRGDRLNSDSLVLITSSYKCLMVDSNGNVTEIKPDCAASSSVFI